MRMENRRKIVNKDIIRDLQMDLQRVQAEKAKLEAELSRVVGREKAILEDLGKFSDDKYEEDMLQLVYEQRKKMKE